MSTGELEIEGASALLAKAWADSGTELLDIARAGEVVLSTARRWVTGQSCPSADQWVAALDACGYDIVLRPR